MAGGQIPFSGGPRLVFILMTADAVYRILDSPAVADVPSSTGHTATLTAETAAPLQRHHVDSNPTGKRLAFLTLTALGVVYGDIGTSPLYALQECFKPEHGLLPTTSNVYGVLSLIVWALISIVAIKYIVFIMRADNNGEGGILALLALIFREEREDGMAKSTLAFYTVLGLYAARFLTENGMKAFFLLGAVVLAVTGVEALYADMGHFGRKPIRAAWFWMVLPALLLNYFGQGALMLRDPSASANPFYNLAPDFFFVPLLVLATLAAIVASQALISGAFSITQQCVQLGFSPRVTIIHTAKTEAGQIYIPEVNRLLMLGCLAVVLYFGSVSKPGAAYGIAVTGTMAITTILFHKTTWKRGRTLLRELLTARSPLKAS